MITIKKWLFNPCETACYCISDETGECVIVDACMYNEREQSKLSKYTERLSLKPVRSLLTHCHFDHLLGIDFILSNYQLETEAHIADEPMFSLVQNRIDDVFNGRFKTTVHKPLFCLTDNQEITFGTHRLCVIGAPGHTPGSVLLWCPEENFALTGDTLFAGGYIGRTDLPGGNKEQFENTLQKIKFLLPAETILHTGHDAKTTTVAKELGYY